MRIAVISDIHGNLEAFQAVLEDIKHQQVDQIIHLGDFIDYGPNPEEVTYLIRQHNIPGILGNHEAAVLDNTILQHLTEHAYLSFCVTRKLISDATVSYIRTLDSVSTLEQLRFVHGVPPDYIEDYIVYKPLPLLPYTFAAYPEWIAFVGHTHTLGLYMFDGNKARFEPLGEGILQLSQDLRYIINTGSVGQPRDQNRSAKYVILDLDTARLSVNFVVYDARETARKIMELGFPYYNAERLL